MVRLAEAFIFRRTGAPLQALDARVRLLLLLEAFAGALLLRPPALLGLLLALLGLSVASRALRRVGGALASSLPFAGLLFLADLAFGLGAGLGLTSALRLEALVAASSLLFISLSPEEVEGVMAWLGLPGGLRLAFAGAVRFFPLLTLDAGRVLDAQRSRGLRLGGANPFRLAKGLVPLLVPLLAVALSRSQAVAEAMAARALGAARRRPAPGRLGHLDGLALLAALLFAAALPFLA